LSGASRAPKSSPKSNKVGWFEAKEKKEKKEQKNKNKQKTNVSHSGWTEKEAEPVRGLLHNARDDKVKEAMKDTVRLQQVLEKAEKDRQVLRSKFESANSTVAFLQKKEEEGQARQMQLKTATSEYHRMVEKEKTMAENIGREEESWREAERELEQWISSSRAFLNLIEAKFSEKLNLPKEEKKKVVVVKKQMPKAPPPAPPPSDSSAPPVVPTTTTTKKMVLKKSKSGSNRDEMIVNNKNT
jgi:hypothetical protein